VEYLVQLSWACPDAAVRRHLVGCPAIEIETEETIGSERGDEAVTLAGAISS